MLHCFLKTFTIFSWFASVHTKVIDDSDDGGDYLHRSAASDDDCCDGYGDDRNAKNDDYDDATASDIPMYTGCCFHHGYLHFTSFTIDLGVRLMLLQVCLMLPLLDPPSSFSQ